MNERQLKIMAALGSVLSAAIYVLQAHDNPTDDPVGKLFDEVIWEELRTTIADYHRIMNEATQEARAEMLNAKASE